MLETLLLASSGFVEFGMKVKDYLNALNWTDYVCVALMFLLFYYVSKTLRENDATKLMVLYWLLILGVGGMTYVVDLLNATFYLFFLILLSMFMLILFNVEVKKSLWDVHTQKNETGESSRGNNAVASKESVETCISSIIRALQNMSKNNVGALIVLSKGNLPKQVLHSGVVIDADISTQLIEGIFFPKAPLHDGAMIIRGNKIQSAGCFLPLTQKSYPKDFGTRHRAGIGITEVSNVISLIVSEETGIISIVKQGNVARYADYDMLSEALRDYYWQELPLSSDRKFRGGDRV